MRRHRNVKIVATLGPASDNYETIKELHLAIDSRAVLLPLVQPARWV